MSRKSVLHTARNGQVSNVLVLAVSLVAGTFAMTSTRRMVQHRRAIERQDWVKAMESALAAVRSSEIGFEDGLRIPFERDRERWILIEPMVDRGDDSRVLVRLTQRETTLARIVRPVTP